MTRFTCLISAILLFAFPAFTGESETPETAVRSHEVQEQTLTASPETLFSLRTEEAGLCRSKEVSLFSILPFPTDQSIGLCEYEDEQACAPCFCVVIRNEPQCIC